LYRITLFSVSCGSFHSRLCQIHTSQMIIINKVKLTAECPTPYEESSGPITPFVKWAGGKRAILPILLKNLPAGFNNYFEPFVGGGALLFQLNRKNSTIRDINNELIQSYNAIKDNANKVMNILDVHFQKHTVDYYYKIRETVMENHYEIAARFIYLNKTCYNGLYRVNRNGKFNVPVGNYKTRPRLYERQNLLNMQKFLKETDIAVGNFTTITPTKGDFVYFDPPYHETFTSYTSSGFNESKQKELYNFCTELNKEKVKFMVSNSDTDFIKNIWGNFHIRKIIAPRYINSQADNRKNGKEVIITNY
jgi:DNA adenine methylase